MPVIACIGHEIDSTLVDFVADKRASTPTAAAELATVDRREIEEKLSFALQDMEESLKSRIQGMKDDLSSYKEDLDLEIRQLVSHYKELLAHKKVALEALNPDNVINRGFSLTVDEEGKPVSDIKQVKQGQKIRTILKDGIINSEVIDTEKK